MIKNIKRRKEKNKPAPFSKIEKQNFIENQLQTDINLHFKGIYKIGLESLIIKKTVNLFRYFSSYIFSYPRKKLLKFFFK